MNTLNRDAIIAKDPHRPADPKGWSIRKARRYVPNIWINDGWVEGLALCDPLGGETVFLNTPFTQLLWAYLPTETRRTMISTEPKEKTTEQHLQDLFSSSPTTFEWRSGFEFEQKPRVSFWRRLVSWFRLRTI